LKATTPVLLMIAGLLRVLPVLLPGTPGNAKLWGVGNARRRSDLNPLFQPMTDTAFGMPFKRPTGPSRQMLTGIVATWLIAHTVI
jgi:hypothetical protein